MHKFTNAAGSVLLVQRPNEAKDVAAFLARQPRVLPPAPQQEAPVLSKGVVLLAARLLLVVLLAIVIAVTFFLVGEETPNSVVRPALTARQRAASLR